MVNGKKLSENLVLDLGPSNNNPRNSEGSFKGKGRCDFICLQPLYGRRLERPLQLRYCPG